MNLRKFPFIFLLLLWACGSALDASSAESYRVSGPMSHKNLSVFLIHGNNQIDQQKILTLQESMEKNIFTVHETSNVNELEVENKSSEFDVFIQSGDIVKGGKQDRVLSVDIIVPAGSGKMAIEAFCVESGRWRQRGNESAGRFSSSNERIASKGLKIAAMSERSQAEVWNKVAETQEKLSANVGSNVKSEASQTSLQLSLEHEQVLASVDGYIKLLSGVMDGKNDVVGFAFAINGSINSADIYASNSLFKKLWPKLLKAAATEAVAEGNSTVSQKPVQLADVEDFLLKADQGKPEERALTPRVKLIIRESTDEIVFESHDEKNKAILHRSYVKKQK